MGQGTIGPEGPQLVAEKDTSFPGSSHLRKVSLGMNHILMTWARSSKENLNFSPLPVLVSQ